MKRIAVAPGDPAGIGYEISVRALAALRGEMKDVAAAVYADRELWHRAGARFAPGAPDFCEIGAAGEMCAPGLYLVHAGPGLDPASFVPGKPDASCARCAHDALTRIVEDAVRGHLDGMCTGPIHKGAMRLAGVADIGHTEILAGGFGAKHPMTMFITRGLRIFFYTRHLSLRDAIAALDVGGIVEFGRRMDAHMRRLGFERPRLAMAALNPHAGDGGQFGCEEAVILCPAAEILRGEGIDMTGPVGADSVFAQAASGRYDAVMSLYHDQGHIAAKTYDFERTVSATLGLPVLRTSVDHGTAFDIAWSGRAQDVSMRTAIEALLSHV